MCIVIIHWTQINYHERTYTRIMIYMSLKDESGLGIIGGIGIEGVKLKNVLF